MKRLIKIFQNLENKQLTFPTAVEPVKDIVATFSLSHKTFPMPGVFSLEEVTTFITPGGTRASSASLAIAKADKGVSSAGLITHVQPAAKAAPTLRVIMAFGKFH